MPAAGYFGGRWHKGALNVCRYPASDRRCAVSPVVTALVFIGGPVAYGVVVAIVGRRVTRRHVREGHNDVLVPLFLTAGVVYAVLLAFMVVAEWESYDAANSNTDEEAALLVPLYRQTGAMAQESGAKMRAAIRKYAEDVIKSWDRFTEGGLSRDAGADTQNMISIFATMEPASKARELISAQFLDTYSQMVFHRNKRAAQTADEVPWIMWLGAIGGGVITVGMSGFLYMERQGLHIAMVSVMSGLFGLLLFIMALLSEPFVGPMAIDPGPFQQMLAVFDGIDHGY
jgi:hypothetical protein